MATAPPPPFPPPSLPDEPVDVPPPRRPLSRRAFVKGCAAASAMGAAGIGAGAVMGALSPGMGHARRVDYLGCVVLRDPAPQGLPLLPLALDDEGRILAAPQSSGLEEGSSVLDWYRYCGHAEASALHPDFVPPDEFLRYDLPAEKLPQVETLRDAPPHAAAPGWYLPRLGEVARVEDFAAAGHGAPLLWRAEGQAAQHRVPVLVLKVDPAALEVERVERRVVEGFLAPTPDGMALLGYVAWCKHFCCVPGWQESRVAFDEGFGDALYCTCHGSAYDPLHIKPDFFVVHERA